MSLVGQPCVQLKRVQCRSRRGRTSRGLAISIIVCPFGPPRVCDPSSDIKTTHPRCQGRRPKSHPVTASRRSRVSVTCACPHRGTPSGGSVKRCAEEKQRKAVPAPSGKGRSGTHTHWSQPLCSQRPSPAGQVPGGPPGCPRVCTWRALCPPASPASSKVLRRRRCCASWRRPGPGRLGRDGHASSQARSGLLRLRRLRARWLRHIRRSGAQQGSLGAGFTLENSVLVFSAVGLGPLCLSHLSHGSFEATEAAGSVASFPAPGAGPRGPLQLVASWAHRLRPWVSRGTAGPGTGKVTRFLACSSRVLAL